MTTPSRLDMLELDIDVRLHELWAETREVTDWSLETAAAFIRAAYAGGYMDALREDAANDRGELCRNHGYLYPLREAA